jgi:ElaB/YqjD/DUF883 family membrane-anchored ribosome-binding protein
MTRNAERLESEIEHDRQEIRHTLDALQEKLSLDSIVEDVFSTSNGGARRTAEQVWTQVRDHPLPALAAAAGLIWFSASAARGNGSDHEWSEEDRGTLQRYNRLRSLESQFHRFEGESDEAFINRQCSARASELGIRSEQGERFEKFKERVDSAASQVNEAAHGLLSRMEAVGAGVASRFASATETARQSLSDTAEGATERLADGASAVRNQGEWLIEQAASLHRSNPLVMGALAIAGGALLGGLIPNTRAENNAMGRSADWAKSKAGELASEAVDAVGTDVEKTLERAGRRT